VGVLLGGWPFKKGCSCSPGGRALDKEIRLSTGGAEAGALTKSGLVELKGHKRIEDESTHKKKKTRAGKVDVL